MSTQTARRARFEQPPSPIPRGDGPRIGRVVGYLPSVERPNGERVFQFRVVLAIAAALCAVSWLLVGALWTYFLLGVA